MSRLSKSSHEHDTRKDGFAGVGFVITDSRGHLAPCRCGGNTPSNLVVLKSVKYLNTDLMMPSQARLGMRWQVQLHMGAIQQLLELGQTKTIYLTDGIKRAIFW